MLPSSQRTLATLYASWWQMATVYAPLEFQRLKKRYKAVLYVQRPTGQLLKLTTTHGLWHAPHCRTCRVLYMDLRRGIFQCPWSFYHEDVLCGDSFNQLKKDSAVALCLMLETENFFLRKTSQSWVLLSFLINFIQKVLRAIYKGCFFNNLNT